MTTIKLYHKHKAGEISKGAFLYEVRKDANLPWITNVTSYDDAVKILKNKGIISEAGLDVKLESNSLNEDSLQDILEPLKDRLESIGYEQVGFDNQFGHPRFEGFKSLPDGSKLRIGLSPSEEELQQKKYTGTADQFSTVDISFTHWTKDGVATKLSDEDGIKLDKESVEKIILMVKNAEQKASQKEGSLNEAKGSNNDDVAINARAYRDQMKIKAAEIKKLRKLKEAAGDVDTKGIYDIKMRNGEVIAKGVKFFPNGEWYQETETGGIKLGGKIPDGASVTRVGETLNEVDNNVPTDPAVDKVNPYFLKKGVMKLLAKEKELTNDSYINALNKAAKQLLANPHAFDEDMFANAKEVEKADSKLETQEVKKNNHVDKANQMKKVKVKALKESTIDELIGYLKKKELVNEDMHHEFHVGSEVHTPNGHGKVVEIVGSTLTVEREDGVLEDVQINSARHFTQKAQEESLSKAELDKRWKAWDDEVASGQNPHMTRQFGGELRYKPEDIQTLLAKLKDYVTKHKGDKEKMGKIKETVKKLKEFIFIDPKEPKSKPIVGSSPATQTALTRAGLVKVPGTGDAK